MKKIAALLLCFTMLLTLFCSCAEKETNEPLKPETPEADRPEPVGEKTETLQTIFSEKSNFSTQCDAKYETGENDDGDITITVGEEGVVALRRVTYDGFLTMDSYFGDHGYFELMDFAGYDYTFSAPTTEDRTIGGKTLRCVYVTAYDNEKEKEFFLAADMTRERAGFEPAASDEPCTDSFILYYAEYYTDNSENVLKTLDDLVKNFKTTEAERPQTPPVTVDYSADISNVRFVDYADENGCFTAKIPEGWAVKTGIPVVGLDLIGYGLTIYDPDVPERQVHFNLMLQGMMKSEEALNWQKEHYPTLLSANLPYVAEQTTEGYFKGMGGSFYDFTAFELIENLGKTPFSGGDLLSGTVYYNSGIKCQGIFSAFVTSTVYPVKSNIYDPFSPDDIDAGSVLAQMIIYEIAPQEEYFTWQPILSEIFASIKFTDEFLKARADAWQQTLATSNYIMQTADEISDMIMDSWERRNKSEDILSQKRSDATLGYERVYSPETDEIYKTEPGFLERYPDAGFTALTDEQYLQPVNGTIELR